MRSELESGYRGAQAGMDMTWVTDRIAVGGGIWFDRNMIDVVGAGITHIIDMQIEFDDTPLAEPYGVRVLWNPTDDDFRPKPAHLLQRGVDFAHGSAGRAGGKDVHSLRGGSPPGTNDDAGRDAGDGVVAG